MQTESVKLEIDLSYSSHTHYVMQSVWPAVLFYFFSKIIRAVYTNSQ